MATSFGDTGGPTGSVMDQILKLLQDKNFGQTTPYQNNIMQQQQQMFTNPLGSGIFQGLVGSVLNALKPGEAQAQQNLQDQFRMAGGANASPLQSGAFAKQAQMLQGNILGQESNAISGLAQNSMGQLMQALQQGFQMGEPNRTAGQLTVTDLLNLVGHGVDLGNAQIKNNQVTTQAAQAGTTTQNSALQSLLQQLTSAGGGTSGGISSGGASGTSGTGGTPGTPDIQALIQALGGQSAYSPAYNPTPGGPLGGAYGGSGAYFDPNPQPQQDYWYAQNTDMGG